MENQSFGIFYNGISSAAQKVIISFDSETHLLHFVNENLETFKWNLNEITFDRRGDSLYMQYGNDPIQNIKTDDAHLIAGIDRFRNEKGMKSLYQKLLDLNFRTHVSIAVALLALIALGYIFVIPWVGEKSVILIPEEFDNRVGDAFFEQNMMYQDIDSAKTVALNRFAQELKLKNKRNLNFIVADSPIVNAFALPNGTIVVFTGILEPMKSYEELVGLIGHEVSHVNNRHSMKMLCRNLSGYLFVSTVLGDVNGAMAVIGDNVNTLRSLSFSREFEHEADTDGFAIVKANKVNPQGMANLFRQLQQEESKIRIIEKMPDFLKTHPITAERRQFIQEQIKKQPYQYEHDSKLQELFLKIKN